MNDFGFHIALIGAVVVYWSILYLLFHFLRRDKTRPVYKFVTYWVTAFISTIGLFFIGIAFFLYSMFASTDYTDSSLVYGKEVIVGNVDGVMYANEIRLYDNNTFYIDSHKTTANGYYSVENDTINLKYNSNYDNNKLPDFLIVSYDSIDDKLKHVSLKGYRVIDNQVDSTMRHYFRGYVEK